MTIESGETKGEVEYYWRQYIDAMASAEVRVTDFVPAGDIAHLAGFVKFKSGTIVLRGTSIIKETGEWRFYGNQRNPPP